MLYIIYIYLLAQQRNHNFVIRLRISEGLDRGGPEEAGKKKLCIVPNFFFLIFFFLKERDTHIVAIKSRYRRSFLRK